MSKQHNACRKCGAEMLPSRDLVNRLMGSADFSGGEVVTLSRDPKQPVLVDALKCSKCQWTVSNQPMTNYEKFALV
jgi:hypothetical protein